jgi:hypothetical protein
VDLTTFQPLLYSCLWLAEVPGRYWSLSHAITLTTEINLLSGLEAHQNRRKRYSITLPLTQLDVEVLVWASGVYGTCWSGDGVFIWVVEARTGQKRQTGLVAGERQGDLCAWTGNSIFIFRSLVSMHTTGIQTIWMDNNSQYMDA